MCNLKTKHKFRDAEWLVPARGGEFGVANVIKRYKLEL